MIILDIDTGAKQDIAAFEGDNTEEIKTIALIKNDSRVDLTGKKIDMGYADINSQASGDIIENLTISNAKQGEIRLPINSAITKKDGNYTCAFKITGEGDYKKTTAPFILNIKASLFNKIGKAILDNNSFSKIQEILNKADTYNKDLEDKLNTLSSLDSSNLAAKENIKSLTDNNAKATELNNTLTSNVASVDSKNKILQDSIKAAEDFSKTLVGGTDFIQMRKDIDTLEDGLKNNQFLAYTGSNITCKNSLEGRTSNMKLKGKTLYKKKDGTYTDTWEEGCNLESCGETESNKITIVSSNNTDNKALNYKEYKKEIQLKQPFFGLKTIQDTIEETETGVQYIRNIGKIVLNGAEDWQLDVSTLKNTVVFYLNSLENAAYGMDKELNLASSIKTGDTYSGKDEECIRLGRNSAGIYVRVRKDRLKEVTVQAWKDYLKDNPIPVYYQVDKPYKIDLGVLETDVDTYQDTTHIMSLNNIPATLDFSIATNYGSVLNQHSQEINNIWNTINNLIVPALIDSNKNMALKAIENNL